MVPQAVDEFYDLVENLRPPGILHLHRACAAVNKNIFNTVELAPEVLNGNRAGCAVCAFEVEYCFLRCCRVFHTHKVIAASVPGQCGPGPGTGPRGPARRGPAPTTAAPAAAARGSAFHPAARDDYIDHTMGIKNVLSLFFFVVAGLLLVAGAISAVGTGIFLIGAETTTAGVIDYEIVENAAPFMATRPGGGVLYYAIVQFETPRGDSGTFTADQGHRQRPYEEGAPIDVLYNPDRPEDARVADFWGLWGRVAILVGLGAVFALLGVLTPYGFGRTGRRANPYGNNGSS